jgi:hypothetical protein
MQWGNVEDAPHQDVKTNFGENGDYHFPHNIINPGLLKFTPATKEIGGFNSLVREYI